ncbi:TPA: hypothetical protein NKY78_002493 [Vibrio parahaemolyticus]|nr:hypothetical protein [Vibrio parahaemolyticus]
MAEPENKYTHELRFGFSSNNNFFPNLVRKFENVFYLILTVLGTVSLTYAGAFAGSEKTIFATTEGSAWFEVNGLLSSAWLLLSHPVPHFLYATIILGFGLSGTKKDYENLLKKNEALEAINSKNSELKSELESSAEENAALNGRMKAKHAQLVETWLNGAFSQLLQMNTNARVSIYYYYNDSFFILARFSPNGRLRQIHKQKFSPTQGVIRSVYEQLECHETKAPIYNQNKPENYISYMTTKYGYTEKQLNTFNMKSCRYFGEAISEADAVIGIILYESEDPNDLIRDELIKSIRDYHSNYRSHLCQFVRQGLEHDLSALIHESSGNDIDALNELGGRKRNE